MYFWKFQKRWGGVGHNLLGGGIIFIFKFLIILIILTYNKFCQSFVKYFLGKNVERWIQTYTHTPEIVK